MNVILGDHMAVLCPKCNGVMKKLYWKRLIYEGLDVIGEGYSFAEWFGCTNCGECIYDKERDVYLSSEQTIIGGNEDE